MTITIFRICIILLVFIIPVNLFSQAENRGSIYISITDIRSDKGDVKISLFDQDDPFPGDHEKAVGRIITDIVGSKATAVFEDIPYGEYAIAIMHDENANLVMDTNWIGIPKEGFGASNDAEGKMGPPKFKDAMFKLDKPELRMKIKMAYF